MNLAICDDEKEFCTFLKKHLNDYASSKNLTWNISIFSKGEELLSHPLSFDLVFLDIKLEKMNGIETGEALKRKNPHTIIFFITSYSAYLDEAFRIQAFRFLPKPLEIARLYKALDDARELLKNSWIVFYDVKTKTDIRLNTNDIVYLEVEKKRTKLVAVSGTYYSNEKISYWRNQLNGISFVTPHSSFITNLDYAIQHKRTELILAKKNIDGQVIEEYEITIAPKRQAEIRKLFFDVSMKR